MKFNFWLVVLLALAPIFILFAGLTAAGGYGSPAAWEITGIVAAAAFVVAYFARQGADRFGTGVSDAPIDSSDPAKRPVNATATGNSSLTRQPHDVDPSCPGYSSRDEVLALLNELLEAERAGARGAREMSALADSVRRRQALHRVATDEARFCAMLFGHIKRLGETPHRRVGAFHEKLAALDSLDDRLELLNRGQGWVVRKLADAVPALAEDALRADLEEMLDAHKRNIARCSQLVESPERVA
jgi:hypothetical protein